MPKCIKWVGFGHINSRACRYYRYRVSSIGKVSGFFWYRYDPSIWFWVSKIDTKNALGKMAIVDIEIAKIKDFLCTSGVWNYFLFLNLVSELMSGYLFVFRLGVLLVIVKIQKFSGLWCLSALQANIFLSNSAIYVENTWKIVPALPFC